MAAAAGIPVPESMVMTSNVNWETFRESYEDYLVSTKSDKESPKVQISILKTLMGVERRMCLNSYYQMNKVHPQKSNRTVLLA